MIKLQDISGVTKEELDRVAKKTALNKYDEVELSPDDWTEEDGVRYLKTPFKVHYLPWSLYTLDCASLISKIYDQKFLYVFAFSITEKSNDVLSKVLQKNELRKKGYCYYYGFQKEELNSINTINTVIAGN